MQKLFWGLLALVVGLELLSTVLLWWQEPNARFSPNTLDQVTDGMSETQVIALFGAPPGDYTTADRRDRPDLAAGRRDARDLAGKLGWTYREWLDDRGAVVILFDEKAKVVWKIYQSVHKP